MEGFSDLALELFPEARAGGFTRLDGTIAFYSRINALIDEDSSVLNFGAGRGAMLADGVSPYKRKLMDFKGRVREHVGADVDPVVRENAGLDEAVVLELGAPLPFEDERFDLVYADHVLEHIDDPDLVCGELARVLKPGGWICARTPNRLGYVAIAAQLVPNRLHARVLKHAQPHRKEMDVFPTRYRLNTRRALRRYFPPERFDSFTYTVDAEPMYFGNRKALWILGLWLQRFVPDALRTTLFVFLRKR